MPRMQGLIYIGVMVVMSCAFQYQAKLLADGIAPILARDAGLADKMAELLQATTIVRLALVLTLAAALFVVWLLALTKLDLSVALPLAAIALVVNAIGTGLLLGEELGALRIGGVVTVALGIVMVLGS
jgi:multidrug transporter EmrE-like cation transporter